MTQQAEIFEGEDLILTVAEVAARLKVIEETVLRLLRAGELKGFKVGAAWRIYAADLDTYITDHANWR